jgi:hypothetical protein
MLERMANSRTILSVVLRQSQASSFSSAARFRRAEYADGNDSLVYSVLARSEYAVSFHHSMLHLFNRPLGNLRPELPAGAEAENQRIAEISRSKFAQRSVYVVGRSGRSHQNHCRRKLRRHTIPEKDCSPASESLAQYREDELRYAHFQSNGSLIKRIYRTNGLAV